MEKPANILTDRKQFLVPQDLVPTSPHTCPPYTGPASRIVDKFVVPVDLQPGNLHLEERTHEEQQLHLLFPSLKYGLMVRTLRGAHHH